MQNILTLLSADSDDEAAVLPPDKDAGVLDENMQRAHIWFVCAKAQLTPAKSWKDVLNSQKKCQTECLGVASVIASNDINRQDSGTTSVNCYVDGYENIGLGYLKHWMPINHSDLPELLHTPFVEILPGKYQDDKQYKKHHTVLKFPSETTTML